jgi:DNA topoisomerase 2-associated protein PAT1
MLTLFTLLVACFSQLDVVKQLPIFDHSEDAWECAETEEQIQLFSGSVLHSILPVVAKASLRLVTGLLGLLLDRSNIVGVAQTRVSSFCVRFSYVVDDFKLSLARIGASHIILKQSGTH